MPFNARVGRFKTRPYEHLELAQMEGEERKKFSTGYYEKVFAEHVLEEITADTLEYLGERISEIAEAHSPNPVIVTASNADNLPLKHSFLIKRSYVPDDEKRIFELILYTPKNPVAWREKLDKAAREWEAKRLSPAEQEEFMQKSLKHTLQEVEKDLASLQNDPLKVLGSVGNDELRASFAELRSKRAEFETDEQFQNYFVSEWKKRTEVARARRREELTRKPPYYASHLPSMLNDEMTVLCRIIGKDKGLVYKHHEYYKKFHSISEPVYTVDNDADDGLHVSFVYGKDFSERKNQQSV